jgi:hypothetical protein
LPLLLSVTGCSREARPAAPDSASLRTVGRSRVIPSPTIQETFQYREASALYRKGDYPAAERILTELLASKELSDADQDFLRKQQAQVRQAAGSPPRQPSTASRLILVMARAGRKPWL